MEIIPENQQKIDSSANSSNLIYPILRNNILAAEIGKIFSREYPEKSADTSCEFYFKIVRSQEFNTKQREKAVSEIKENRKKEENLDTKLRNLAHKFEKNTLVEQILFFGLQLAKTYYINGSIKKYQNKIHGIISTYFDMQKEIAIKYGEEELDPIVLAYADYMLDAILRLNKPEVFEATKIYNFRYQVQCKPMMCSLGLVALHNRDVLEACEKIKEVSIIKVSEIAEPEASKTPYGEFSLWVKEKYGVERW